MTTYKTHIEWLTCDESGHEYPFPDLGSQSYGQFVLRSKNQRFSYCDFVQDLTLNEVSKMLSQHKISSVINSYKKSDIFQDIYGPVCCDLDEFGDSYKIDSLLKCPYCQNPDTPEHDLALSYDRSSAEIPYVAHEKWDRLTDAEKVARVDQALREMGHLDPSPK